MAEGIHTYQLALATSSLEGFLRPFSHLILKRLDGDLVIDGGRGRFEERGSIEGGGRAAGGNTLEL